MDEDMNDQLLNLSKGAQIPNLSIKQDEEANEVI